LQQTSPWTLAKEDGREAEVDEIIYLCAESLRICGILLQPFMPQSMHKQLDLLGVAPTDRSFANALFGSDANYGTSSRATGAGLEGVLFPPLM
jgi:methionyl-tRNA synthetase